MVEFRHVSYRIGSRPILDDVSFSVEAGETLVLLGRSGSGKSTALRMTNGMLFPSGGQVLVDGRATTEWDPVRLKRSIGYVIQEGGLFPHYTVAANVGLVPTLEGWPPEKIAARTSELLEITGLAPGDFSERFPRQLSGGQRQRVGVARALAADPMLLLFDEPFGALDPVTRHALQLEFLHLRREWNKTAMFVTHDVREALLLATRIALLVDGRVALLAAPAEFRHAAAPEAREFLACIEETLP
jgi:osmoprotectant transport system ATP-binding protein